MIVRLVSTLLFASGPATVLGRIGTVVVLAVYLVLGRGSWTHIRQEILELSPATADTNATASVAVVVRNCSIVASFGDAFPDSILGRPRLAVGSPCVAQLFSVPTTAACGLTSSQIFADDLAGFATVATTSPIMYARAFAGGMITCVTFDDETIKGLIGQALNPGVVGVFIVFLCG